MSLCASDEEAQVTRDYSNGFSAGGVAAVFDWSVVVCLEVDSDVRAVRGFGAKKKQVV